MVGRDFLGWDFSGIIFSKVGFFENHKIQLFRGSQWIKIYFGRSGFFDENKGGNFYLKLVGFSATEVGF